jgi:predicted HTH domain antitoxin
MWYSCTSGWLAVLIAAVEVTIKLPDEIAEGLGNEPEGGRRVAEALVLQRYLTEEISLGRLAELLGLSHIEAEDFLDRNNARLPYTREMLEEDRRKLAEVFKPR